MGIFQLFCAMLPSNIFQYFCAMLPSIRGQHCTKALKNTQQINFFKTLSGSQTVTDVLSVLMWVQTVCKVYQQAKKVAVGKERVEVL